VGLDLNYYTHVAVTSFDLDKNAQPVLLDIETLVLCAYGLVDPVEFGEFTLPIIGRVNLRSAYESHAVYKITANPANCINFVLRKLNGTLAYTTFPSSQSSFWGALICSISLYFKSHFILVGSTIGLNFMKSITYASEEKVERQVLSLSF
jgi:hypothetical protein